MIRSLAALSGQAHVLADRLADLVADGQRRVQAGQRVLEDEADLLAAQLAHVLGAELEEVDPVEHDRAGDDLARRIGDEARDRQRRHALAAARLADQPERLAVADVEADVVDRLDDAVRREEVGRQAADLEQVVGLAARSPALATASVRARRTSSGDSSTMVGASATGHVLGARSTYCFPLSFGSSASRRPSPRNVKLMRARAIRMPGR